MELSEKQKIQQLLSPRYQLLRNYPGNVQPIGYIHAVTGDEQSVKHWAEEKDKYPFLFHKLNWWEQRTTEEMPPYISYKINYVWYIEPLISHHSLEEPHPYFTTPKHKNIYYGSPNTDPQPATLEEYEDHKTISPLLTPRYKVIQIYPNAPYILEQILLNPPKSLNLDSYPDFFQKLNWWDDRSIEDLPKYIIHTSTKEVRRIIKFHPRYKHRFYASSAIPTMRDDWFSLSHWFEPATEKQFLEQKAYYQHD